MPRNLDIEQLTIDRSVTHRKGSLFVILSLLAFGGAFVIPAAYQSSNQNLTPTSKSTQLTNADNTALTADEDIKANKHRNKPIGTMVNNSVHDAVKILAEGGFVAEPVVMKQINKGFDISPALEKLSEKEGQILKLMAGGFSNKEIAASIFLAEGTVKNHVSNILAKLNTRDRTRAVLIALNERII